MAVRIRRHLRPLYAVLDFSNVAPANPWLAAFGRAKDVFEKRQRLSQRPLTECPDATLPKRLRPYLVTFDAHGRPIGNFSILSRVLTKYEATGNAKALTPIKEISPAAWRHIHLNGHYTFRGNGQVIDLDAVVASVMRRQAAGG
jgi:hypothetical protein